MTDLDRSWHDLWRCLQAARRRRDIYKVTALGAELVNLSAMLRQFHRRQERVLCYHGGVKITFDR